MVRTGVVLPMNAQVNPSARNPEAYCRPAFRLLGQIAWIALLPASTIVWHPESINLKPKLQMGDTFGGSLEA